MQPALWLPPQVNRNSIQSQGLALWWPGGYRGAAFDRNAPTTYGSGAVPVMDGELGRVWSHDGTANGFVNRSAVQFDGLAFNAATGHTVTSWVKLGLLNGTAQNAVNWTSGSLTLITLGVSTSNTLAAMGDFGSLFATIVASPVVGTWYHLAYKYETIAGTGTSSVYLNGRLVATSTAATHTTVIAQFDIGRRNDVGGTGNNFTGNSGDTRFYLRALSDAEIYQQWDPRTRWELYAPQTINPPMSEVVIVQVSRPDADTAAGSWTTNTGATTNLFAAIDETPANDSDYIQSSLDPASADICKISLSSVTDPVSSSAHIVRYRYAKSPASTNRIDLTVRLKQGSTEIASWAHADIGTTLTTAQQTLTGTQADAISDYSNLDLWFEALKV